MKVDEKLRDKKKNDGQICKCEQPINGSLLLNRIRTQLKINRI